MDNLVQMKCTACRGDEPPLTQEEIVALMPHVPAWDLVERDGVKRLARAFKFRDFAQALAFTNEVGRIAEREPLRTTISTKAAWWASWRPAAPTKSASRCRRWSRHGRHTRKSRPDCVTKQ
jgi:4a-hydroxytetrahydrobiopterin dehydratase